MNKKHLLVAASALVVGLSMYGGNAWAGKGTQTTNVAVAASVQAGEVKDNGAWGTDASNSIGSVSGAGLVNIQQNGGANSLLQDDNTLAAVLNCSCSSDSNINVPVALSTQVAEVRDNVSGGAHNTTDSDTGGGLHIGPFGLGGHDNYSTSTAVQSANGLSSFNGTGMYNISQNVGNNSLLQSSNTTAAIIGATP
ncbi:MAG: hypothetical protein ACREEL_14325 [Stellaceae bacterium]